MTGDFDLAGYEYREVLLADLRSGEHMRELVHAARQEASNIRIRLVLPEGMDRYRVPDRKMLEYADSVVTREADRDYVIKDRDTDRLNIVMELDLGRYRKTSNRWSYYHRARKYARKASRYGKRQARVELNSYLAFQGNHDDLVAKKSYMAYARKYSDMYQFGRTPGFNFDHVISGHAAHYDVHTETMRAWRPPSDPTNRALREPGKVEIVHIIKDEGHVLTKLQNKLYLGVTEPHKFEE